jgi:hypothetical protein
MYKYNGTSPSGCVVALLALILIIPFACGGSILFSYIQDGFLVEPQFFLLFGGLLFGLPLIFVTIIAGGYTFARGRILLAIPVGLVLAVGLLLGIYGVMVRIVMTTRPATEVLEALAPACQRQPVAEAGDYNVSSASPVHLVLLGDTGGVHMWTGKLPAEWRPDNTADAEIVACVTGKPERIKIETCTYILGPSIKRYKETMTVTVIAPKTGVVLSSFTVDDLPRQCKSTEEQKVTELYGKLTFDAVFARLQTYVTR